MKKFTTDQFRDAAKRGGDLGDTVLRLATAEAQAPSAIADRTYSFTLSDESVDGSGDIIRQAGWKFDRFLKNSVALWSHDVSIPPIGRWHDPAVVSGKLKRSAYVF
jgi:hypothetical protein